jgi:hypothetical protein
MRELNDQIARVEMCSEQLLIHLRSVPKDSLEANAARSDLLAMLQRLVTLKGHRQQLEESLELEAAQSTRWWIGRSRPSGSTSRSLAPRLLQVL